MVIPLTPKTQQYRVPSIAEGMGEKPKPAKPSQPAVATRSKPAAAPAKAVAAAPQAAPKVQVASACPSEEQRHRNYASRMVEGIGLNPTDDLKLFASDGTPQPNLTHVMLAMSAFELGVLRASPDLVEGAIARAVARLKENTKAEMGRGAPASVER
jgi:hypothetical protein